MDRYPLLGLAFWTASCSAAFSIGYSVFQISEVLGVVTGYLSQILIFGISILIAPSFVAMMTCVYHCTPNAKKVWSHVGLLFAVLYAVFVMIVYMTELFVVIPHGMRGESDKVALLAFNEQSIMYVIDGLGYTFMCLSTLFLAPIFTGEGVEKWLKRLCIANGLLAIPIFIVYIYFHPILLFFGAMWMITVPSICVLLAVKFKRLASADSITPIHLGK